MLSKVKKLILGLAYLFPLAVLAQVSDTRPGTLGGIAIQIQGVLNLVVPIIMVLALIYFFVGLVKYIMSAGDEESKGAGRSIMINGVIALFVMAAVWGLVNVLVTTFGVDVQSAPTRSIDLVP